MMTVRLFSPGFEARGRDERARHNRIAATKKEFRGDVNQSCVILIFVPCILFNV
jgi:hypothetical protein